MTQDTRSLIAIGLSVGVFLVWYGFLTPKKTVQPVENQQQAVSSQVPEAAQPVAQSVQSPQAAKTAEIQSNIPVKTTVIESDLYRVELSNDGAAPISWQMKKYKGNGSGTGAGNFIEMVPKGSSPLQEIITGVSGKSRYNLVEEVSTGATYVWRSKELEVTKKYQFDPNSYQAELFVSVKNLGKAAIEDKSGISWQAQLPKEEKRGFLGFLKGPANEFQPVYYFNNSLGRDPVLDKDGNLLWGGIEDRYFISSIIPRGQGDLSTLSVTRSSLPDGTRSVGTIIHPKALTVLSGESLTRQFTLYVGPKEMDNLKKVGMSLEKAIDYGWFGFVSVPILYLLKFFYGLIHNYGIAIILLTVFVKLLLNPLSRHSMKSMKAMQNLQPRMKELKEKYKNDRERLNAETMQLFKAHKVNPMGGCLPMLIQLPIYIALYKVLWNSIELYRAPFCLFYRDLSAPDPYLIMPIILGVAMFLQQKMTPSATADPAQAKVMQIMPIMFTAFMLFLPSGLVLYILVNTVMGVIQQWMMNKDLRLRDIIRGKFQPAKI